MSLVARIRVDPHLLHQGLPSVPEPSGSRLLPLSAESAETFPTCTYLHTLTHAPTETPLHVCPLLPGGQARWHSAHPHRASLDLKKCLRLYRAIRGCLKIHILLPSPQPQGASGFTRSSFLLSPTEGRREELPKSVAPS